MRSTPENADRRTSTTSPLRVVRHRSVVVAGFVGAFTLGALGCDAKTTPSQCSEMLDKYLDMVVAGEPASVDQSPAELHASREARKAAHKADASYLRASNQCTNEITRREYRCAMKAFTPETWQACID